MESYSIMPQNVNETILEPFSKRVPGLCLNKSPKMYTCGPRTLGFSICILSPSGPDMIHSSLHKPQNEAGKKTKTKKQRTASIKKKKKSQVWELTP